MFSRARHERFRESDALRRVFEGVVAMCVAAGLVGGEAFSVDASLIKADVDKKKRVAGDQPMRWPKARKRLVRFASTSRLSMLPAAMRERRQRWIEHGAVEASRQGSLIDRSAIDMGRQAGSRPIFCL